MLQIGTKLEIKVQSTDWHYEAGKVYMRAIRDGRIIPAQVGEHYFEYAVLPRKPRGILSVHSKVGFSECGLAFVIASHVPEEFRDYVGLHETIESRMSGKDNENHGTACKVELEEVFKEPTQFVERYARWLLSIVKKDKPGNNYFDRAIPGFLEYAKKRNLGPLELLIDFKKSLDAGCHLNPPYDIRGTDLTARMLNDGNWGVFNSEFNMLLKFDEPPSLQSIHSFLLNERRYGKIKRLLGKFLERVDSDEARRFYDEYERHYLSLLQEGNYRKAIKFAGDFPLNRDTRYLNYVFYKRLLCAGNVQGAERFSTQMDIPFGKEYAIKNAMQDLADEMLKTAENGSGSEIVPYRIDEEKLKVLEQLVLNFKDYPYKLGTIHKVLTSKKPFYDGRKIQIINGPEPEKYRREIARRIKRLIDHADEVRASLLQTQ